MGNEIQYVCMYFVCAEIIPSAFWFFWPLPNMSMEKIICYHYYDTLCSRNFQNVKLRLDFVDIWWFYSHSNFYVKSNFGEFKWSKNVLFDHFRPSELWNLVNLGLESCSNLLKSKLKSSRIIKNDIFGPFEFAKIGFHVNSEWR